jgi:hypothetical protein
VANYEILSGEHTVELLGATDVQDVYQVTARALQSHVVYHVRFPPVIDDPETIAVVLTEWATQYDDLRALPYVVGVGTLQDIDASGQINDITQITVGSASGRLSAVLEDPNFSVVNDAVGSKIAALRAKLDAIEAG